MYATKNKKDRFINFKNTDFKFPKREWNHLIIHIIEKIFKISVKTLTNIISGL